MILTLNFSDEYKNIAVDDAVRSMYGQKILDILTHAEYSIHNYSVDFNIDQYQRQELIKYYPELLI